MFSTARPIIYPVFNFAAQVQATNAHNWAIFLGKALSEKLRSFAQDRTSLQKKTVAEDKRPIALASTDQPQTFKKLCQDERGVAVNKPKKEIEDQTSKASDQKNSFEKSEKSETKERKLWKKIRKLEKKSKEASLGKIEKQHSTKNIEIEKTFDDTAFEAIIPRLQKFSPYKLEAKRESLMTRKVQEWPVGNESKRTRITKLFQ